VSEYYDNSNALLLCTRLDFACIFKSCRGFSKQKAILFSLDVTDLVMKRTGKHSLVRSFSACVYVLAFM